jgi:hypothetical protein
VASIAASAGGTSSIAEQRHGRREEHGAYARGVQEDGRLQHRQEPARGVTAIGRIQTLVPLPPGEPAVNPGRPAHDVHEADPHEDPDDEESSEAVTETPVTRMKAAMLHTKTAPA